MATSGFSLGQGGGPFHAPHADMRILSWNYRSIGNSNTVNFLSRLVKSHNPNCLCLFQTKYGRYWMAKVFDKLGFCNSFVVEPVG